MSDEKSLVRPKAAELGDRRLDAGSLEEVLRRAVEIEQRDSEAKPEFSVDDAVRIAGEIGVSEASVRGALVLVDRDALVRPERPLSGLDRWFGAPRAICARNVPGPAREVRRIIGKVLSDQLFRVVRNQGELVTWERSDSFFAGMRRALDFDKRYQLSEVERLEVTVRPAAVPDRVDVRISLDFSELRRSRLRRGILLPMVIGAPLIIGAAALGPLAIGAWVMAGGGLAAGGGIHMRMRSKYLEAVGRSCEAIDRLLDHLEHER